MPPGELEVYKFEHYIFQIQRHDCSCDSPKHPEDQFTRESQEPQQITSLTSNLNTS